MAANTGMGKPRGPNDGAPDEEEGPDTLPTSPDKPEEPLGNAPPTSVSRRARRPG